MNEVNTPTKTVPEPKKTRRGGGRHPIPSYERRIKIAARVDPVTLDYLENQKGVRNIGRSIDQAISKLQRFEDNAPAVEPVKPAKRKRFRPVDEA